MHDFQMTLDTGESAVIRAWAGKHLPRNSIEFFIWAEEDDKAIIAIQIDGDEKFVVEVTDRGNKIDRTK